LPMISEKITVGLLGLVKRGTDTAFAEIDLVESVLAQRICSPPLANRVFALDIARHKTREEKLLNEICRCQSEERRRIGQELHDGVAQWVAGAAMEIDGCE